MCKNQEKDYSLLRPFDLEAAKRGEPFVFVSCGVMSPREYVAGPDANGEVVVRDEQGRFILTQSLPYNMAPLCWIEGRPVYKGDVLWHRRRGRIVASYMIDDGEFLCEEGENPGDYIENFTWTPPKVKREGWVNIYSQALGELVASVSHAHATKEAADAANNGSRIACVRIEWEE